MTLEELLKAQGLTDEQIAKVIASMKENKLFITTEENIEERYGKLKEQKTDLETQIADRDKQLEDLSKKVEGNEELETQIQELQELNKATTEDYENKLKEQSFNYALEVALRDNRVKNTKAVQALIDKDLIKLDGDKLLGLEEQITKLKETDDYLFELSVSGDSPDNTGTSSNNNAINKEQFIKMGYKERVELLNTNPTLYNQLNG